jgi:hypothetical protein
MDKSINLLNNRIFDTICRDLIYEGDLLKGVYWATPFGRSGDRGVLCRSEAHFIHVVARSLESLGFICLLEDPYLFKSHWDIYFNEAKKDKILPRCDIKAILKPSNYLSADTNILHMEIKVLKHSWLLPKILGRMSKDVSKLKEALSQNTPDGRVIAGFLLIIFDKETKNCASEIDVRLQQFVKKVKIQEWVYNYKNIYIPSGISCDKDKYVMNDMLCLVNLWISEEVFCSS